MAFYWLPPDRMCRSDTRIEILIDDWTLLRRAICGKWSCSMKRSRLWFWFIFERSLMTHFRDFLQIRGRSATILAESLECVRNKWQAIYLHTSPSLVAGSSNGIPPLLFNAGLVSHYRRYLNPVDPRMFVTNGGVAELNKSNCKGKPNPRLQFT